MINQNSNSKLLIILAAIVLNLAGCSIFGKNQPETIPLPPKNLDSSQPLVLPQIGNSKQSVITESEAAMNNESQVSNKQRKIIEDRGPGGAVNKITVDNPGKIPDYYIYPSSQQDLNINDNPNRVSPPSWQYSW